MFFNHQVSWSGMLTEITLRKKKSKAFLILGISLSKIGKFMSKKSLLNTLCVDGEQKRDQCHCCFRLVLTFLNDGTQFPVECSLFNSFLLCNTQTIFEEDCNYSFSLNKIFTTKNSIPFLRID